MVTGRRQCSIPPTVGPTGNFPSPISFWGYGLNTVECVSEPPMNGGAGPTDVFLANDTYRGLFIILEINMEGHSKANGSLTACRLRIYAVIGSRLHGPFSNAISRIGDPSATNPHS